jgi:purine nucleosidase
MGDGRRHREHHAAAEYNFYVDPEAAKIVLAAASPLTLVAWTMTRTHRVFRDDKLPQLDAQGTPLARFFGQVNRKALDFDRNVVELGGSAHPDSMTCAAILDSSLVLDAEDAVVDAETTGELTEAGTWSTRWGGRSASRTLASSPISTPRGSSG